jgi:hypothetical protein
VPPLLATGVLTPKPAAAAGNDDDLCLPSPPPPQKKKKKKKRKPPLAGADAGQVGGGCGITKRGGRRALDRCPGKTTSVATWLSSHADVILINRNMISSIAKSSPKPLAPKMLDNSPPGTVTSSTSLPRGGGGGCRRKIAFQHPTFGYAIPPPLPAKVARRNERERKRVKNVNCGFEYLRSHIPAVAKEKKMSKVETLRHAVEYIQNLQGMLAEQDVNKRSFSSTTPAPLTLMSSHPPPPLTMMGSPTPTPSSSSSSENTSPPTSFDNRHQLQFQYPSPLTPRTPTASDFSSSHQSESGYSGSSFYSGASTNSSQFHTAAMQQHQQQHLQRPASSMSPQSPQQQQFTPATTPFEQYQQVEYFGAAAAGADSEEDELLDVIARWQDQED